MSNDQEYTPEQLIRTYIRLRDLIQKREEEYKQEIGKLKDQQEMVSNKLLDMCNEANMDSFKTPEGTVSRRISSRYWASDWSSMYEFISERQVPYLLEKRIHNGNMKQYLEENPDDVPPGLQADNKYTIQVRKPTSK